jgi:hypothetical protein
MAAQLIGPRWGETESVEIEPSVRQGVSSINVLLAKWSQIGGWTPFGGRVGVAQPPRTEQTVPLSVEDSSADLVSASAYLASDLTSEFGEPDPVFLRRDGSFDVREMSPGDVAVLSGWAARHDIVVH